MEPFVVKVSAEEIDPDDLMVAAMSGDKNATIEVITYSARGACGLPLSPQLESNLPLGAHAEIEVIMVCKLGGDVHRRTGEFWEDARETFRIRELGVCEAVIDVMIWTILKGTIKAGHPIHEDLWVEITLEYPQLAIGPLASWCQKRFYLYVAFLRKWNAILGGLPKAGRGESTLIYPID